MLAVVRLYEAGRAEMTNAYPRMVQPQGNTAAQQILNTVFQMTDREWRGLGVVPQSGLALRPEYAAHDAALRFPKQQANAAAQKRLRLPRRQGFTRQDATAELSPFRQPLHTG